MPTLIWNSVTTEFNGKPITGSYSVNKETVTVRYRAKSKATGFEAFPEAAAKMLLRELANAQLKPKEK
jgi:hypothetical protein